MKQLVEINHLALKNNFNSLLKLIYQANSNVMDYISKDAKNTLLHAAVEHYNGQNIILKNMFDETNLQTIEKWLALFYRKNKKGETPLSFANTGENRKDLYEFYYRNSPRSSTTNDVITLLKNAANQGSHNVSQEELIDTLIDAIVNERIDDVDLLIQHITNFDSRNNMALTPLMFASIWGREEIFERLLNAGASLNINNK